MLELFSGAFFLFLSIIIIIFFIFLIISFALSWVLFWDFSGGGGSPLGLFGGEFGGGIGC